MQAVKAFFDGNSFIPLAPISAKPNQVAIVTILDDIEINASIKTFEKFVGKLSNESYKEITDALSDTERVDKDEW